MKNNYFISSYSALLRRHGPQGWWPIDDRYHKGDFSYPKTTEQKFEICIGAILTQNTAWTNVKKAIGSLKKERLLDPKKISAASEDKIKECVKSAGYFNQKTRKLKEFSEFFLSLKNKTPAREDLLSVWGVGKETADSILLYAYSQPIFVVDAYTKRVFEKELRKRKRNIDSYDDIRDIFEDNLPADYKLFQEYHALIVEEGKRMKKNKRSD